MEGATGLFSMILKLCFYNQNPTHCVCMGFLLNQSAKKFAIDSIKKPRPNGKGFWLWALLDYSYAQGHARESPRECFAFRTILFSSG
jgi:hypothetical protein